MHLPVTLVEKIYLETFRHFFESYSRGFEGRMTVIKHVYDQLHVLSQVDRRSYDVVNSEFFLRSLFQLCFPSVSCSNIDSDGQWNGETLRFIVGLTKGKWSFLWKAMFMLHFKAAASRINTHAIHYNYPPDDIVLWINNPKDDGAYEVPHDDKSDKKGSYDACCIKFVTPTRVIVFSSSNSWITVDQQKARYNASSLTMVNNLGLRVDTVSLQNSVGQLSSTSLTDDSSRRSNQESQLEGSASPYAPVWKPPQRYYVFEDMITISSHMQSLHYINDPSDPVSLRYENCKSCYERYPLCGKSVEKHICGSCLYLMDMDLFGGPSLSLV